MKINQSPEYSISIIVPVYNEIQLVKQSVTLIDSFIGTHMKDYEILLIESGSNDGSGRACDELPNNNPHIKVIHEGARNGYGSALKLGYQQASKDLVWVVTADLPFPLESILQALPHFERVDCVLSYRLSDQRNLFRRIQSSVYNQIMNRLLGLTVRHVNSAFKVFKREVIQSLPLESNGWFIDAEVIYWLRKKNVKTIEIPVPLTNRTAGESKVALVAPLFMLRDAFKFIHSRKK